MLFFIIGVLTALLIIGGGPLALRWPPDDAEAQDENGTWQVEHLEDIKLNEFIDSLPSVCDFQTYDYVNNTVVFYRCP
jgi:hypothetical protein